MFQKSASLAVQKKKKSSKKSSEKMQTEVEHQKDNNMTVKQNGFYAYETNSEFNVWSIFVSPRYIQHQKVHLKMFYKQTTQSEAKLSICFHESLTNRGCNVSSEKIQTKF